MAPDELTFLQDLLRDRAGFVLAAERAYLVENRLGPIARREGFGSVPALLRALREGAPPSLVSAAVEAMLPGDTQFFRDREPFRQFREELAPALAAARPGGRVRVLSAGCGAGQEAWSLAAAAAEAGLSGVQVLGLDLNARSLEKARAGLYTQFEVQRGLRAAQLVRWFERVDDMWRVAPPLSAAVAFERANLLHGLDEHGRFDLVFCRYVLGEMAPEARRLVLSGLDRALADDGVLFLGAGEAPAEVMAAFRPVAGRPGLFVKTPTHLRHAA